jgi:hypothetical protein
MKFITFLILICFTIFALADDHDHDDGNSVVGSPTSINGNNIGNIYTVNLDANAVLSNNIESNIVALLAALLNQQAVVSDDLAVAAADDTTK